MTSTRATTSCLRTMRFRSSPSCSSRRMKVQPALPLNPLLRLILIVCAACCGLVIARSPSSTLVRAQTSATIVSVTLTPPTATVGDHLTYSIVIDHESGTTLQGPGFGADYGGLEVID